MSLENHYKELINEETGEILTPLPSDKKEAEIYLDQMSAIIKGMKSDLEKASKQYIQDITILQSLKNKKVEDFEAKIKTHINNAEGIAIRYEIAKFSSLSGSFGYYSQRPKLITSNFEQVDKITQFMIAHKYPDFFEIKLNKALIQKELTRNHGDNEMSETFDLFIPDNKFGFRAKS